MIGMRSSRATVLSICSLTSLVSPRSMSPSQQATSGLSETLRPARFSKKRQNTQRSHLYPPPDSLSPDNQSTPCRTWRSSTARRSRTMIEI